MSGTWDWLNGYALEFGRPVSTPETPAERAQIAAYLKRQPKPFMAPQVSEDDDACINTFGDGSPWMPKLLDELPQ